MVKALADRLAEAYAEYLHQRVRREWGYGSDERLSREEIIDEPVAWAGAIVPHFGHQIGDFSGRIVTTRLERPDIGFVFAVNPSGGIAMQARATLG